MNWRQLRRWYGHYLADDEIEVGKEYLYCTLTSPPRRVRITDCERAPDGVPLVFIWREVRADGSLHESEEATLPLFREIPNRFQLKLKVISPC
jgi:hypothetical protein